MAETVKRVVITRSYAAIGYGHADHTESCTDEDWTDLDNAVIPVGTYPNSKTMAERAVWD
jgi:dihydroflavonol-4-reductase